MSFMSPEVVTELATDWTSADPTREQIPSALSERHLDHIDHIVSETSREIRRKYAAGQIEHGGFLPEKPRMLEHAFEEVADLSVYILTAMAQQKEARRLLAQALSSRTWQDVAEAYGVLTGQALKT